MLWLKGRTALVLPLRPCRLVQSCRSRTHASRSDRSTWILLLRRPDVAGPPHLLVVGRDRRKVLVVEHLGDDLHRLRTALAETCAPPVESEVDVVSILAGKIWDCRRFARAFGPAAIVASLDPLLGAADLRELLSALNERGVGWPERQ
jgi:hypothetical protein